MRARISSPLSVRLTEIIFEASRLNWFSLNISFFFSSSSGGIFTAVPISPGPSGLKFWIAKVKFHFFDNGTRGMHANLHARWWTSTRVSINVGTISWLQYRCSGYPRLNDQLEKPPVYLRVKWTTNLYDKHRRHFTPGCSLINTSSLKLFMRRPRNVPRALT